MYAKVIVEVASENTDDLFTYAVPNDLADCLHIGSRVFVPFGFQKIMGYVLEIASEADTSKNLKEILEVIDFEQGLTEEQIALAKKISVDTKSFLISCLDLMYPGFMKSRVRKFIRVVNHDDLDAELALVLGPKNRVPMSGTLLRYYKKIKKEINKGNLEIVSDVFSYGKRKLTKFYALDDGDLLGRSLTRRNILEYVQSRGEASQEDIIDNTGCSVNLLKKLVDEKYLKVEERFETAPVGEKFSYEPAVFDFDGRMAREKYRKLSGKPFLLFSEDEAFKLNFLLDLAGETIQTGKKVMIVTPTILSNAIVSNFFKKNLQEARLLNFSSRLTNDEYYRNYQNVIEKNVDIVIGTKPAIFLPLENIGLIVMIDEENPSYVSEQNPKYSVSEVLKDRAQSQGAKVVFASAVPQITTYWRYAQSEYFLLTYPTKNENAVELVNMREELEDLVLSRALKAKLAANIQTQAKSLLILNSLGYSPISVCSDCGTTLKCEKCQISMVYHKEKGVYKCGYCGNSVEVPRCNKCSGTHFQNFGVGLEKLKERLKEVFPEVRIAEIDSGTMNDRLAYEDFLEQFEDNRFDIVIGTANLISMLGLGINLVGVINADGILNYGDYRSSEMVFRMISKLRRSFSGSVIVQGYNLDNYAITDAVFGTYDQFYEAEIGNRQNFLYPPFTEINRLIIIGDYKDIYYYANYFKKIYHRIGQGTALGPVYLPKVRGVQLILKHNNFSKVSELIDEVNKKFKEQKLIVNFERYPSSFR
jgi:primosomal protein N' (replication factor Y)